MKKILFAILGLSILLALTGCGGGDNRPPEFTTEILSDHALNGDIEVNVANVATVSQGNLPSVFAGVDPVTGSETRAFLTFPLSSVPVNAIITSATLDIFIDTLSIPAAATSIPIRIELVSFSPPTLQASDYDRGILPALAVTAISPPISRNDIGRNVPVDVTSLMAEAQRRGLANFQIRILEDFGFVFPGVIEIDDSTNARAPLLTVTYF